MQWLSCGFLYPKILLSSLINLKIFMLILCCVNCREMRKMLDQVCEMSQQPFEMNSIKEGFKDLLSCQVALLESQARNQRTHGPIEDAIEALEQENELRKLEIHANTELVRNTFQRLTSFKSILIFFHFHFKLYPKLSPKLSYNSHQTWVGFGI